MHKESKANLRDERMNQAELNSFFGVLSYAQTASFEGTAAKGLVRKGAFVG
jgi:hypothetical protein